MSNVRVRDDIVVVTLSVNSLCLKRFTMKSMTPTVMCAPCSAADGCRADGRTDAGSCRGSGTTIIRRLSNGNVYVL